MPGVGDSLSWMLFVDGENLTIRTQELCRRSGIELIENANFKTNYFFWHAKNSAEADFPRLCSIPPTRSFYYTSFSGDDVFRDSLREQIWSLGFEPNVFKKSRPSDKAKGVDIALTKDMLSHAFRGNYDVALLIAGDGDYLPLVEEVKRLGKRVEIHFMQEWTAKDLRLATDRFIDIVPAIQQWAFRPNHHRKIEPPNPTGEEGSQR